MPAAAISPRGGVAPKTTRLRGQSIIECVPHQRLFLCRQQRLSVEQQYCDALVLRMSRFLLLTSAVKPAQPVRAFLLSIARTI